MSGQNPYVSAVFQSVAGSHKKSMYVLGTDLFGSERLNQQPEPSSMIFCRLTCGVRTGVFC
jgi:hypothetical protein